eukprot:CAMPEP_0117575086 /NCGR_PEP_ID=MMETSP0784-20121206/62007_1 /TAXON_ID=39447 /ORGANISM="" /LENGTH=81 /DNA_ID=CAMNT_0005374109 /DNA_START=7 /DNA_END=249 /DNA_ORIENTATION=+
MTCTTGNALNVETTSRCNRRERSGYMGAQSQAPPNENSLGKLRTAALGAVEADLRQIENLLTREVGSCQGGCHVQDPAYAS